MEDSQLAFVLGLVNGIIALLAAVFYGILTLGFSTTLGVFISIFYLIAAILLLVGAFQAKGGKASPAWILLMIGGILTLIIGILGIVAAMKARNLR
ncbi:TPA: hypothetical protein H1016_05425 [archaeon]|uniref:Uncharacterized protein n=1 Tax=Candidatus Naiadarchaeum limnaeum TaxID=2756139 RepID=A0A832UPC4_9ARCH|nr:hypothetical protein [Candidatus Naiadarchaeum limnaeum]